MGFLKSLTKTALDVATSPVDVVKDLVTMGGVLADEEEPYTFRKLKKIVRDIDEIPESVDDGLV